MASFLLNREAIIKEIESLSKLELIFVRKNLEEIITLIEPPSEDFWDLIEAQGIYRKDLEKLILNSSNSNNKTRSSIPNPNRKPRLLKLENQNFLINEDDSITLKYSKLTNEEKENGIILTKYSDLSSEQKKSAKIQVEEYNNGVLERHES